MPKQDDYIQINTESPVGCGCGCALIILALAIALELPDIIRAIEHFAK